jgi:hypothetical protein
VNPIANPYTPNAGAQPQAIVGRDDQLESFELLLQRMIRGRSEQSMIITGLRGVGKTVLLGQFRTKALAESWSVIEMEVRKHDDTAFRREMASKMRTALFELSPKAQWTDRFTRAAAVLRSFTLSMDELGTFTAGLDVAALEGFADHGDLTLDLTDLFIAVGEAAQSNKRGVVLLLDEIQFLTTPQLEAMISAIHKTVQRSLPVILVGAGLPQIAELAGDAKSYAERLFKFPRIGNLQAPDDARAFRDPASDEGAAWEPAALARAIEVTEGYPYFVQELGHAVWPIASNNLITLNDVEHAMWIYDAKLDSSFFRVRLDRTTELQRAYLRAMAELGPAPHKAAAVAELLDRTSTQCGPVRAELVAMGLLYTPEHGYAAFTVPHFDRFMKRAMPTLEIPPKRSAGNPN